jgi:hypothetical protein
VGLSFPAFGFRIPEQKGWAELEPENPKPLSDLKQKKKRPGVFPFKVAGNWPKRAGWRPQSQSASHSGFLAENFSRARFHCQTFLPLFLFGPRELALQWQCPD